MAVKTITKKELSARELSILYDRIYNIADRLFKKYNPCDIRTKDGIIYCIAYNDKKENEHRQKRCVFLCCSGCYYNGKKNYSTINGCITKCLACKLHLCSELRYKRFPIYFKLLRIKEYAKKYNLPIEAYYLSKEDWLKRIKE